GESVRGRIDYATDEKLILTVGGGQRRFDLSDILALQFAAVTKEHPGSAIIALLKEGLRELGRVLTSGLPLTRGKIGMGRRALAWIGFLAPFLALALSAALLAVDYSFALRALYKSWGLAPLLNIRWQAVTLLLMVALFARAGAVVQARNIDL